ncbi:DUF4251 domain-containing protein [Mucilaginibacter sp.]|jgi:hypothetical protein|uniref:DUF4251 domain-containing protein n=1 Tax=Mucilaginibacter sp. TaxID=1882438 RepID=UPI002C217F3B|nr:DUF4251 domain-containing protein [Mucilaginibacter sp.]HTI61844.1 DUF4251 domain-containing protein [Mucilaginibacter sp.]
MKSLGKLFFVSALVLWGSDAVFAQSLKEDKVKKATEVKNLVDGGRYTFEASKKVMGNGDSRYLRHGGDMDVSKDTLIVYLPEEGKAPGTPVKAINAGITCTGFGYQMNDAVNGGWNIDITPKGDHSTEIKEITLLISPEGYATLDVMRPDKKSLIFYGYVKQHIAQFPPVSAAIVK